MLKSRAKHDPLGGSTTKGIVVEKVGIEAKQPNSGIRRQQRFPYQERKQTYRFRSW